MIPLDASRAATARKKFAHEMLKHSEWMVSALCASPDYKDHDWFSSSSQIEDARERERIRKSARDVCARCPVMVECRNFADTAGVTAGIWAGQYYGFSF